MTINKIPWNEPHPGIRFAIMNCIEGMAELEDNSMDLVLTDPPYGITEHKWDIAPDWNSLANEFNRILTWNGLVAIFGRQPMVTDVMNAFTTVFDFRFDVIWHKGAGMWSSHYAPIPVHEHILFFKKRGCLVSDTIFNLEEIKTKGKPYKARRSGLSSNQRRFKDERYLIVNNGNRYPKSVLSASVCGGTNPEYVGHPTQKPVALMKWPIIALTNPGDIILDPYLGSGTTALVCKTTGRRFIGFEMEEKNRAIIKQRISRAPTYESSITKKLIDFLKDENIAEAMKT